MATTEYFLRLGDILGSSEAKAHMGEIEVESFHWDVAAEVASHGGGGAGAGRVEVHGLDVVAESSKASPAIFLACASGRHLVDAVLTGQRTTGKGATTTVLVITLRGVTVTGYEQTSVAGEVATDVFALDFEQVELTVDGVTTGWDVRANRPL
jgi:type VI secretion system secreted protein Hcp